MFKEEERKNFANGSVYMLRTEDGYPIEVTDTFLPYYTKDASGRKQNALKNGNLSSRAERWMIGVSVMSGCSVGCKFCATGKLKMGKIRTKSKLKTTLNLTMTREKDFDIDKMRCIYV
jgi:adenine C2-methylase RlmN of 23S rRNA A2503 and tRNA A37